MKEQRRYGIYNPLTGELVFEGTDVECAAFCGGTPAGFRDGPLKAKDGLYHGYRVEVTCDVLGSAKTDAESKRLAEAWDAFCEPIRKAYGISVRKGDRE